MLHRPKRPSGKPEGSLNKGPQTLSRSLSSAARALEVASMQLVALHSDFDGLIIGRNQVWKIGRIDAESDGARGAWLSGDEAGLFER